ncbi:MAG TPA: type II secretion system protein [bacterium]|nr:type II secretion system protein [bacterium]
MTKTSRKGFTVIELLLVVILISILGAIVIPRFRISTKQAKVQACEIQRALINKTVDAYYLVEATWPLTDMSDIKTNAHYFPDGIPTCPVDLTSYVLAPSPFLRVSGHREGDGTHTWN